MQIAVRKATVDDAASVSGLLAELGYAVAPEQVAHQLGAELGRVVQVAVIDTSVVGLVGVSTRFQLHKAGRVSTIDELVVTASKRGCGIGRMLIDAAVVVARQQGADRLDLYSRADRVEAHRFYESTGFDNIAVAHYMAMQLGS